MYENCEMPMEDALHYDLDAELRARSVELARNLWDERQFSERIEPFRPFVADDADAERPTLHLDDISGIPGVEDVPGVEEYQHRARIRAGDDDAFVASTRQPSGYESYNRDVLRIGAPEILVAEEVEDPLACAAGCLGGETLEELAAWASSAGRVAVDPFMAIEAVWQLASRLDERGADVAVRGPPLPSLWIANDKRNLSEMCERLFEDRRTVDSHVAAEPGEMADRLLELADPYPRVGLKRPRSASAMGNKVFASDDLLEAGREEVRRRVRRFLESTNWPEGREVLLVRWIDATISPSTQCWVPPHGEGRPYVDGIYEQMLVGGEGVFAGSRPSPLPLRVHEKLAETSLALLTVYQRLGYVGRCSFDFVVTGDPEGDFGVRVVDCNGRWGGTSLPMQLVDRVVPGERPPYRAQDFVDSSLEGAEFIDILEACDDHLFRAETGAGRFIFYNPGPLREHGKFDVISMGRTQEEAAEGIERLLPDLLGV
jgi:hypothetical protein